MNVDWLGSHLAWIWYNPRPVEEGEKFPVREVSIMVMGKAFKVLGEDYAIDEAFEDKFVGLSYDKLLGSGSDKILTGSTQRESVNFKCI